MKHEPDPLDAGKRSTLNIRIKPEVRGLIDEAARAIGKNRTDFIIDAVQRAAEDTLLDRTLIKASPEAYDKFVALLDASPKANKRLFKALQTPPPWERK
jgi:uncharacterized protein (DUF1778 family)